MYVCAVHVCIVNCSKVFLYMYISISVGLFVYIHKIACIHGCVCNSSFVGIHAIISVYSCMYAFLQFIGNRRWQDLTRSLPFEISRLGEIVFLPNMHTQVYRYIRT